MVKIFKSSINKVRTLLIQDDFHFVANDILEILELEKESLEDLHEDDKRFLEIPQFWIINEKSFYNLAFISKNEKARSFQNWLSNELDSKIDSTFKTLLPNHLSYSLVEDGRFELKQKMNSTKNYTFKFFDSIASSKAPQKIEVQTRIIENKIWFGAAGICKLTNLNGKTLYELKEDIEVKSLNKEIFVSEQGLYHLLFAANHRDSFSFAKIIKENFIPEDEHGIFLFNKTNSKVFRSEIKLKLQKYISISLDGNIEFKEACKSQKIAYKLFDTYSI